MVINQLLNGMIQVGASYPPSEELDGGTRPISCGRGGAASIHGFTCLPAIS